MNFVWSPLKLWIMLQAMVYKNCYSLPTSSGKAIIAKVGSWEMFKIRSVIEKMIFTTNIYLVTQYKQSFIPK